MSRLGVCYPTRSRETSKMHRCRIWLQMVQQRDKNEEMGDF